MIDAARGFIEVGLKRIRLVCFIVVGILLLFLLYNYQLLPKTRAQTTPSYNLTVDAASPISSFSSLIRGVATNNWNYLWHGLWDRGAQYSCCPEGKYDAIVEATKLLKPGIIRFAGGLWANSVGWNRANTAPDDGAWVYTDQATGTSYNYRHAYKPAMVDAFAKFSKDVGAQAIIQMNVCDNNPKLWADMAKYANIEKGYNFKYWELGNEQTLSEAACVTASEYADRFVSYRALLKAVDPSIKLLGPVPNQPPFTGWYDTLIARAGTSLDVLTWHWYQLTEWTADKTAFAYEGGSVEALLAHDGNVGSVCHDGFGCTSSNPIGGNIVSGRLDRWEYRRGIAEAMMNYVKTNYKTKNPSMETAITEYGPHAVQHNNPINSNHIAAIWLADTLARWAYNGLDIVTYYSLEDGNDGPNPDNSRGLLGIWDSNKIDVRPIYSTMFMYAQYFGDQMVKSSTSDPDENVVVWASKDSKDVGKLKLMLVNLKETSANTTINVNGFTANSAVAYEMTSAYPLSLADPESYTEHSTTINGVKIPDVTIGNLTAFRNAVSSIPSKAVVGINSSGGNSSISYTVPAYSAVAITLNGDGVIPLTPTPMPSLTLAPTPTSMPLPTSTPTPTTGVITESFYPQKPSAPAGRVPTNIELNIGESTTYTLVNGEKRTVALVDTDKIATIPNTNLTLWATATVSVGGNGIPTAEATIPAAYFQAPRIINGVRVSVGVTQEFNDGALRDGRGTSKAAQLLLSDGAYTSADLSLYQFPISNYIWQEGSNHTYFQAFQYEGGYYHHGGFDMGLTLGTPLNAWEGGTINATSGQGYGGNILIYPSNDGKAWGKNLAVHFDKLAVTVGQKVNKGDYLGTSGLANWPHLHWYGEYEIEPILAESYVAQNDPVKLSYNKDWLAIGPFDGVMSDSQIAGESTLAPHEGDTSSGAQWKEWDNLVPGVVLVREAIDPYPNSGWADVNGSYQNKIAYLFSYVYSDTDRSAVLRIGRSDPMKVWWNGQRLVDDNSYVNFTDSTPAMELDKFTPTINLSKGWNSLLIKTKNDGPKTWNVAVRISDTMGNPIPLIFSTNGSVAPLPVPIPTPLPTILPTPTPLPTVSPTPSTSPTPVPRASSVPPSQTPPGGLLLSQIPQFITLGSDDNWMPEGIDWFVNTLYGTKTNPLGSGNSATLDGSPLRGSFYVIGLYDTYGSELCNSIRNAYVKGNEIGNHTYDHRAQNTLAGWLDQLIRAEGFFTRPLNCNANPSGLGIPKSDLYGVRAPMDTYNNTMYDALKELGYAYAASTATGWGDSLNGTNLYWPGTLEDGFPLPDWAVSTGNHPAQWEVPQNWMEVPTSLQTKLGLGKEVGYCDKDWFDKGIEGADISTLLKYNLDLHLNGNRAPLNLCVHSQEWGIPAWQKDATAIGKILVRQEALLDFLNYALTKPQVRLARAIDVINWMKSPVSLGSIAPSQTPIPTPTPIPATVPTSTPTPLPSLTLAPTPSLTSTPTPTPIPTQTPVPLKNFPKSYFALGLANQPSEIGWMTNSGVPWDFRYQYLSGGVNTGNGWSTWSSPAGQYATSYMNNSDAKGYTPVFTYYMLVQSSPNVGDENPHAKLQSASTMNAYFADWKLLLQKAGAFGKPVIIHHEPDLWGFIQRDNSNPLNTPVSVQSSGFSETLGFENNARGFAKALVALRDTYAPNAILAWHASHWATGTDLILNNSDPVTIGNQIATFFTNLNANFDLIFFDPSDRDASYYQLVLGSNRWWDSNDFIAYKQFVKTVTEKTGRKGMLWQLPLGNTLYKSMNNTTGHYQDNHVQYFLQDGNKQNIIDYINAGLVGILFGRGTGGQTNYLDNQGDGVTNPAPINGNNLVAQFSDDDGGFLRLGASKYYQDGAISLTSPSLPSPIPAPSPTPTSTPAPTLITPTSIPTPTPTLIPTPTLTPFGQVVTIQAQVSSGSNDSYVVTNGWPGYSDKNTVVFAGAPGSKGPAFGGWRWINLNIPKGATITNAYVQLNQSGWGYKITTTLSLENSANPNIFTTTSTPYNRWQRHTNFTTLWNWSKSTPGSWIQTPSLTNGIQELVNRYGGLNSLVLLENGQSTLQRQYHSWTAYDGNPAMAARLIINYEL